MELSEKQENYDVNESEQAQTTTQQNMQSTSSAPSQELVDAIAREVVDAITTRKIEPVEEAKKPSEDRIAMLSDGVFAIAMTLLVLSIQIPLPSDTSDHHTFQTILSNDFKQETMYYIITFGVLAGYWINHRVLLNGLKRVSPSFLLLNLLFLAFVAFFPVATNFLKFTQFSESIIIYTCILAGCGYSSLLLWVNAFNTGLLSTTVGGRNVKSSDLIGAALTPTYFLLSLFLLFIPELRNGNLFYSWLALPVIAIIGRRLGIFDASHRLHNNRGETTRNRANDS
jgi:uncharacterized membrane protein